MRIVPTSLRGGCARICPISHRILRMDCHNRRAERLFRRRGNCTDKEHLMPPYLSRMFQNDLIDAFSSELPGAVWSALAGELEVAYLLGEQRLPRQGGALRDVYFP